MNGAAFCMSFANFHCAATRGFSGPSAPWNRTWQSTAKRYSVMQVWLMSVGNFSFSLSRIVRTSDRFALWTPWFS